MEYIYAVMLLHNAGKEITEESVTEVITSAGLNPDHGRIRSLVSSLAEVDIEAVLQTPVLAGAPTPTPALEKAEDEEPKEEPEKEKEQEEEEEEDMQGLGALFGPEPPG
ncbi:MAG: 50S ribosomal protein P1 [Candidatus Bathyarchaeia archaeon]